MDCWASGGGWWRRSSWRGVQRFLDQVSWSEIPRLEIVIYCHIFNFCDFLVAFRQINRFIHTNTKLKDLLNIVTHRNTYKQILFRKSFHISFLLSQLVSIDALLWAISSNSQILCYMFLYFSRSFNGSFEICVQEPIQKRIGQSRTHPCNLR